MALGIKKIPMYPIFYLLKADYNVAKYCETSKVSPSSASRGIVAEVREAADVNESKRLSQACSV